MNIKDQIALLLGTSAKTCVAMESIAKDFSCLIQRFHYVENLATAIHDLTEIIGLDPDRVATQLVGFSKLEKRQLITMVANRLKKDSK